METINRISASLEVFSGSFTPPNIILMMLGLVFYFFGAFKAKRGDTSFSLKVWWADNWYNIPMTLAGVLAYFMLNDSVSKAEAFLIGMAPNLIIDWAVDYMNKKKGLR